MKVALVHDWLDTWAGGEQVLHEIAALYPGAPLFTLVDFFSPTLRAQLGHRVIHPSFIQRLPFARSSFRRYLALFPRAIESLDVSAFDLVVSSSHAVAKGVRTHERQLHICYCFSPMRYAWDLRDQYLSQVGLDRGMRGHLAGRLLDRLAQWDRRTSDRVDEFVAISQHIAQRIRRCYDRTAEVIYPPVTIAALDRPIARRNGLYVTVSRLVPYKRLDTIAAAFRMLPDRELVIIGEGPERARIEAAAGPNVRVAGQLDDTQRDELLAQARAFVFAAEEDFGIAPIEAQAFGTPVIALRKGAVIETIAGLDSARPTGVFFDEPTPEAIVAAVRTFESNADRIDPQACRNNAARFSTQRFRDEFAAFVADRYAAFRATVA
ncbi:MAG TPA: glycosyltransferase [Casimicrobiaceae bacterium]|nr:glycosyltransferase [Casimicrobiaceae bacterium]